MKRHLVIAVIGALLPVTAVAQDLIPDGSSSRPSPSDAIPNSTTTTGSTTATAADRPEPDPVLTGRISPGAPDDETLATSSERATPADSSNAEPKTDMSGTPTGSSGTAQSTENPSR